MKHISLTQGTRITVMVDEENGLHGTLCRAGAAYEDLVETIDDAECEACKESRAASLEQLVTGKVQGIKQHQDRISSVNLAIRVLEKEKRNIADQIERTARNARSITAELKRYRRGKWQEEQA